MTALVGLVTVMATQVLHGAIRIDGNFIDGKEAEALATKMFVCLLPCTPTSFGKTILT